jgi:phospholipid/cholesterol/gamma-HCH transport system permease protein
VRDEMYGVLRVSWFPMTLAVFTFGLMVGILGLNFTDLLGAANRYGQYFFIINVREFTPWINSMVVAGIVGAAVCSDLGARKVREELDALDVLGVDPVRELVLPRIVSVTLLTPLMMIVSLLIGVVCALVSSVSYGGVPAGEYFATVYANLTVVEIAVALVKSTIIGFVIGIVCSYMGLEASGGAAGVGRAVNRAVVIAFALVFVVDLIINLIALGLFPEMQTVR